MMRAIAKGRSRDADRTVNKLPQDIIDPYIIEAHRLINS